MIEFTPAALEAIEHYKQTLQIPEGFALRVGIRQKNSQDKGLLIGFDEKNDKDRSAEISGVEVIYNAGQIFFFAGMVIDFQDQQGRKGFKFLEKSKQAKAV
ncbi:MAG: iron-sulfur cluster biosynthesis family protein [bacterium]|nr:iron-sulfur cluster biosynthesis family protein [bacterium]